MAISLTTDIVADVLRAAEPQRLTAARRRLVPEAQLAQVQATGKAHASAAKNEARAKAHQQFEAVMLRSFTEQMMPKEASSIYGEGTAANVWRSLQVDLMSQQLAKSGGIGIAKMLDRISTAEANTAASLGLNELSGASSRSTSLSTAGEWPYFSTIPESTG